MAKRKDAGSAESSSPEQGDPQSLGEYLANIRAIRRLKLREVEKATDGAVSNAYLSQLETNKIARPSPNVLHALAMVYVVPYETLMQKAGYISPVSEAPDVLRGATETPRHGRAATFADKNLTQEEEENLLEYLAFLRSRRGKSGKTG
jgi:transcriptional regulator with XRE-family HTH domain